MSGGETGEALSTKEEGKRERKTAQPLSVPGEGKRARGMRKGDRA